MKKARFERAFSIATFGNIEIFLYRLKLINLKRFLPSANNHHSTKRCTTKEEKQNARVDGCAREVTKSSARKVRIIAPTSIVWTIACIPRLTAREHIVRTWDIIARIRVLS